MSTTTSQTKAAKKLMLIYNVLPDDDLLCNVEVIPAEWLITTDRRYFQQADAVVFHLPSLYQELQHETHDREKQEGQIWVARYQEANKIYKWSENPAIRTIFDLWMTYQQDADVVYPYYRYEYPEIFLEKVSFDNKQNKSCMSLSRKTQYVSRGRMLYLNELMKYTRIDSFGNMHAGKHPPEKTTSSLYCDYKFVIAFEDVHEKDFVTEKFFDPLLAGSVPIYLGAPNIADFAPGDNCFVDVRRFESPRSLTRFINTCYENEQLYGQFFEWKNRPIRQTFIHKAEMLKELPLVRLCRKIDEKILALKIADTSTEFVLSAAEVSDTHHAD